MSEPSESSPSHPSVSEPIHADRLRRAADFLAEVRRVQRESGRKLTGRAHLSDETLGAFFDAWDDSRLLAELRSPPDVVVPHDVQGTLFERFEELCRRRRIAVPDDLRPAVYRLLALELAVNGQLLGDTSESLASATLYNGVLDALRDQFPEFADTPGLLREAAQGYPSDPATFLADTRDSIARLEADERFAQFRETPGVFRQAAVT